MQANQTDIQRILGGVQQYVVPLFQRPYSWETRQWNILWQDLLELSEEERPRNHFIGSIVTMPSRSVPEGVSKYVLIDGQQRITTLLLILAAMRDKARKEAEKLAARIDDLLLKNRHQDDLDVYKLLPTQSDRGAFCAFMEGQVPSNGGQIAKAFDFFAKKLRLNNELDLEKLYTVIGKSLILVSIVLDKDDNPYLIFESLNAKGRPLAQADLIRNYFFMRVHFNRQEEVFTKYWKPMQDDLNENLTEFIRHFLMRDGHIVKQGDVYFAIKETVENRSEEDDTVYLGELARFSKYYRRLLDPRSEPSSSIRCRLNRLNRIEATTAYPFLLNAYDDFAFGRLSEADFIGVLDILEAFLIRRFICNIPTNALSKIFVALYSQALKANGLLLEGVREILKDREFPRDQLFRERFTTFRLYGGGDRLTKTRLSLERLEESLGHKEAISVDGLNIEIEHVMPQTLTEAWKKDLGEKWEATHETWLHTVGNLTLTGYNPELSNADYGKKRAILERSHVELNRYFSGENQWNEETISRRAEHLANLAIKIWANFARGDNELDLEAPDQDEDEEDVKLLKVRVLDLFGGEVERTGSRRYRIHKVHDGKIINIKYSRAHKDYYWFGIHASLWEDCMKSGVSHLVFILGQHGFVTVPFAILENYLAEAGTSPKSDGTVRHYHLLISREPQLDLFHHGNPERLSLTPYFSGFPVKAGMPTSS